MLWRSDVNAVTILYADGQQETLPDQWDGRSYALGSPPGGRVAPTRGFGWIWATKSGVSDRLGWGLVEEKGFCARIQYFDGGFVFRSATGSCGSEFNRANDADFPPLYIAVSESGSWAKA